MTISPEERVARATLVDAEILLDAVLLNPLARDEERIDRLRDHIAGVRRQIATLQILGQMEQA